MAKLASISDQDSAESLTFDWFNIIKYMGFRVAEYAQMTQSKVDEFEYASGNKVVKAFVANDWKFYDDNGCLMAIHSLDGSANPPKKLKITFRIQKNCQNGQSITFVAYDKHPQICPVCLAYRIFLRAKWLGQSDNQPMGVFVNKQGITKYFTGSKITEVLHSIAKACHPDLTRDELMRFSSHSGRVWAIVLLNEASMNPDFNKS